MKNKLSQLVYFLSKINRQHIQLAFILFAVLLPQIGIMGAPDDGGGVGR